MFSVYEGYGERLRDTSKVSIKKSAQIGSFTKETKFLPYGNLSKYFGCFRWKNCSNWSKTHRFDSNRITLFLGHQKICPKF